MLSLIGLLVIVPSSNQVNTTVAPAKETQKAVQQPEMTQTENSLSISCSADCLHAPVSKEFFLVADYTPDVSTRVGYSSTLLLTEPTWQAFERLKTAALSTDGISIEIISAYRSYQDQQGVFSSWVTSEESRGLSRDQAEQAANQYSARAGQSEHQLGTTLDIRCSTCESFNIAQNADVTRFLQEQAHKFGFVISYTEGSEEATGYTYEPWHIRYIGADLATQLYEKDYINDPDVYLEQFLSEIM